MNFKTAHHEETYRAYIWNLLAGTASQTKLSKETGISRATISSWVRRLKIALGGEFYAKEIAFQVLAGKLPRDPKRVRKLFSHTAEKAALNTLELLERKAESSPRKALAIRPLIQKLASEIRSYIASEDSIVANSRNRDACTRSLASLVQLERKLQKLEHDAELKCLQRNIAKTKSEAFRNQLMLIKYGGLFSEEKRAEFEKSLANPYLEAVVEYEAAISSYGEKDF